MTHFPCRCVTATHGCVALRRGVDTESAAATFNQRSCRSMSFALSPCRLRCSNVFFVPAAGVLAPLRPGVRRR